jgi:OOP family OmpA-OmpF porin
MKLSAKRAKAVAFYLQSQGVDNTRFVVVGNGQDKPVGDNNTEDGKVANRRTDVYFKTVK